MDKQLCPDCGQRHNPLADCPAPNREERLDERVEEAGPPPPRRPLHDDHGDGAAA